MDTNVSKEHSPYPIENTHIHKICDTNCQKNLFDDPSTCQFSTIIGSNVSKEHSPHPIKNTHIHRICDTNCKKNMFDVQSKLPINQFQNNKKKKTFFYQ